MGITRCLFPPKKKMKLYHQPFPSKTGYLFGSLPLGDPEVDLVGPEMDWMAHQWRSAMLASDGCIYAVPCNASRCALVWLGGFSQLLGESGRHEG